MSTNFEVQVRRSNRRRRTVSAFWQGGVAVVAIPGHFSAAQEREWVEKMLARLQRRKADGAAGRRPGLHHNDTELAERAKRLSREYLAGRARPAGIRWVTNQNSRWGSASPRDKTIRISDKLIGMPAWVVDYVIVHELAHLLVASHGPAFWTLVANYPHTERAKAFLSGAAYAMARALERGNNEADGSNVGHGDEATDPDDVTEAEDITGIGGRTGTSDAPDLEAPDLNKGTAAERRSA